MIITKYDKETLVQQIYSRLYLGQLLSTAWKTVFKWSLSNMASPHFCPSCFYLLHFSISLSWFPNQSCLWILPLFIYIFMCVCVYVFVCIHNFFNELKRKKKYFYHQGIVRFLNFFVYAKYFISIVTISHVHRGGYDDCLMHMKTLCVVKGWFVARSFAQLNLISRP